MRRRGPPSEEEYGRVTNPERFRVLHTAMLDLLARMEADFDVHREDRYGIDGKLERHLELERPSVRMTPSDPEAAQLAVAFTSFPGLLIRFGLWWEEILPVCGCDACDENGERLVEELRELVENVTAGRFRESYDPRRRWMEGEIWGATGGKRGRRGRGAEDLSDYKSIIWKPWPRWEPGTTRSPDIS